MKTLEEIKKGLDECTRLVEWLRTESCNSCIFARRYDGDCTSTESCQSSLAANLIEKLCAELEQVTRERDAAVGDLAIVCHDKSCEVCAHYKFDDYYITERCELEMGECEFEWRGAQEVERE
jgi:hypothetical protein